MLLLLMQVVAVEAVAQAPLALMEQQVAEEMVEQALTVFQLGHRQQVLV